MEQVDELLERIEEFYLKKITKVFSEIIMYIGMDMQNYHVMGPKCPNYEQYKDLECGLYDSEKSKFYVSYEKHMDLSTARLNLRLMDSIKQILYK